jgi:ferric-dicitrate binding protein FerR (iron transport regulator)
MFDDTLIRAARGMIRNHGHDAETKAAQRADSLEQYSPEGAEHWREVARVVRVLQAHSGVPVPANPLSHTLPG